MKRKLFFALLLIFCSILSFFLGLLYFPYKNKKYEESNIGMKLNENRKKWGKPEKTIETKNDIIDTYYPIIPLNEYKFFFNKKDSLMNMRWKEY